AHRCAHRHALRAADRGLRHRAHYRVRAQRLDRPLSRAVGREDRLHLARRHARPDADHDAVRRARGAAGAARGATRSGGRRRDARGGAHLRGPAHHPADGAALAPHGLHAGVRPRARGVRLGDLHRGKSPDEDRDHPAPHRHPPRGVRLPGRRRSRSRDARHLLRGAVRDQPAAGVGPPPAGPGGALMAAALPAAHGGDLTRPGQHTWVHAIVRWVFIATSLAFLAALLLAPLATVFAMAFQRGLYAYLESFADPDTAAAIRLTLTTAAVAVPINTVFGLAAAWAIAKFEFRGKSVLIPLMQQLGNDEEEAAITLGADGWMTFFRVTLPKVRWGLVYGVVLCNARAMGEFGAVSVVSGHIRGLTNTMPLHIEILYNEYNFVGAFAVASLLTLLAGLTLVIKTAIERTGYRRRR